jgi:hypothetical protein
MRNTEESSSTRPFHPSAGFPSASSAYRPRGGNAFTHAFLVEVFRQEDPHLEGPAVASGLVEGAFWAGPWDVEPVSMAHGDVWAVVRRGESVAAGGRAVALAWHRSDALLIAATLPSLAAPNHLTLGEREKRLGFPVHDAARCLGHLARAEPRIVEHLHVARSLLARPESLALAVEALGREEIPVLGRALMRRVGAA